MESIFSQNVFFRLVFILFMGVLFSFVPITGVAHASDSSDKDNVLIGIDKNGTARGYNLLWTVHQGGTYPQESAVVYKDGVAYVTSLTIDNFPGNRNITAIDVATGQILDTYEIGSTFASPVIDGNTIYIGTGVESWNPDTDWTGTYGMYSLDISNIKTTGFVKNWYVPITGGISETVAVDATKVYFTNFVGNKLYALNKSDGTQAWVFSRSTTYQAMVTLLHDGSIYMTNSYGGANSLYKIDATTGLETWEKPIIGKLWDNSLAYDATTDAMYMAFYYGSKAIASYDMDGNLRWQATTTGDSLSFTGFKDGVAFFSDLTGRVYARNASDGTEKWTTRIGDGIDDTTDIASPTLAGGLVFMGSKGPNYPRDSKGRGRFYALDEQTGKIVWEYRDPNLSDVMSPPSIADGILFENTNHYDVYAFDVGDGGGDWPYLRYTQDNTGYSPVGLTKSKYVDAVCTTAGLTSTCDVSNSYTGRAIETKLRSYGDMLYSVLTAPSTYDIHVSDDTVYLPKIAALGSLNGVQITTGSAYDSALPRLSTSTPESANVLDSSYNSDTKKISLSFDDTTSIAATIQSYNYPFLNATSTVASTSVVVSASGLSGTSTFNSVRMKIAPSGNSSVDIHISSWETTGDQHKVWTETGDTADTTVGHTLYNLTPGAAYAVRVDNGDPTVYSADTGTGSITFSYSVGSSKHSFDVQKTNASTQGGGMLIGYGAHNPLPGETFSKSEDAPAAEQSTNESPTTPAPKSSCPFYNFTRTLAPGSEGKDVEALQKLMNCLGFTVAESGPGSPGHETIYYFGLTAAAVRAFQEAYATEILDPIHLTHGTNVFGPMTNKEVKTLAGS